MANLPTRNNNPGDLKDPATGSFRKFGDASSGFTALKADLKGKMTGNTSTGLGPNSSLAELAAKWAPASDNNNPIAYADTLGKKLGVSTDVPIGSLNVDNLASAIAGAEGYQGPSSGSSSGIPSGLTVDQFAQKIKEKYPQYQGVDNQTLTQKILAKYPQYQSVVPGAAPATEAGTSNGYVDPNAPPANPDTSGYGFITPPDPKQPEIAGQPTQEEQQQTGLSGLLHGAGDILSKAESPFLGVAAIPTQLLAKAMGRPDPFANGIPGGVPGLNQRADVTPLDWEKKAGDVAQVGSYFVPGGEGIGAVAGAAGMGALQGAGSAMSSGENLANVASAGALGAGTGAVLAGGTGLLGAGIRGVGDQMSGEAAANLNQGIHKAYSEALNLNAAERGFESRSGKDLAQVLMDHQAPLGRYENGTLDASHAIPKLQEALTPLNEAADAIVGEQSLNTKASNFISLDNAHNELVDRIKASSMDSLEKEHAIATAEKLFDATKREYGDVVAPQVGEKIKQVLQGSAFKKALSTSDALNKNVSYLASDVMRGNVERAIGGDAAKEYKALNLKRSDLVDAIKRLSKLDGMRQIRGGRLGNMMGGIVGSIAGASAGLGPLGALAGDYFGTRATEYMNSPASKIGAARLKAKAAGVIPGLIGSAGRTVGKGIAGVGQGLGKGARAAGLAGNLLYSNDVTR